MAKSKNRASSAIIVHAYAELEEYVRALAAGHLNMLAVLGPPGTGKSQSLKRIVGNNALWIDGTATPCGLYLAAFEHRNQTIILDDVDGLFRDPGAVRILKSLCQTDPIKSVSWHSNASTPNNHGVPRQFKTTSRVAIIANEWKTLNLNVRAVEDRGHVLSFEPSPLEIHKHAALWFWDQEIFDFVANQLHLVKEHSLRHYHLAWELKSAGMDWKSGVLARCLSGKALEVAKLKSNTTFISEEDRAAAFVASGHGCRATYFNHAKLLRTSEEIPQIVLANSSPPSPPVPHQSLLDMLKKRHGDLGSG